MYKFGKMYPWKKKKKNKKKVKDYRIEKKSNKIIDKKDKNES